MFPPSPARRGIKIAIIGNAVSVALKWLATLTARNSPISVMNSQGSLAIIAFKTLPDKISSSSTISVEIPEDW